MRLFPAVNLLVFVGCSALLTGSGSVPTIEDRANGYLVSIPPVDRSVDVGAFVAHNQWIILTVVDPEYDTDSFESLRGPLIDSLSVSHFPSATQVSMRFTVRLRGVEVVRTGGGDQTILSVFRED